MENKRIIKWRSEPQKHDYPAAASYLSLVVGQQAAENAALELESAEMSVFPAKDIFRASMLSLLGVSNSHVEGDREESLGAKSYRHPAVSGQEKWQGDNRRRLPPSVRGLQL